jgi:hypothetical protein
MARPMSFSDRQQFVQALAVCRNLAVACGQGEYRESLILSRCHDLIKSIDGVAGELVGDSSYFQIVEVQTRA